MHGEPLQSGSTFGREDLPTSPDSDPARLALLCLMWEVRQRGLDVGLSTEAGHAPEQIWRTAAARNVDLIVLPESLFGSFRPVASRSDTFEAVQGAPCPLLIRFSWKIPANKPSGFARILHLSPCYLSLSLIASSNSLRYLRHC